MGVKKLQRAIAEYRGISFERLVGSIGQEGLGEGGRGPEPSVTGSTDVDRPSGPPLETKRKYRRHPKPDDNAPERPPSAYVIFSNRIREEVKDQNLSFTQIAKLVGDRWQKLDPNGKEPYEVSASAAKEKYNIQLSAYRKTDEYKEYMAYLADFKAKHGQTTEAKRPKLEPESSGGSISTKSLEAGQEGTILSSGHFRGGSIGSAASSPFIGGSTQPTSSSGSVPQRPQMPSSRSGSPPSAQHSREHFRPGLISGHSSVSDDSATVRSEVPDPVIRTAGLSLSAASATPPLPSLPPNPVSIDSPLLPDPLARSRLSYFVQQQNNPLLPNLGIGQTVPGGPLYAPTLSSPTAQDPSWRTRPADYRGFSDAPRAVHSFPIASPGREQLSPTSLPPIIAPDRPPDFMQTPSPRILPPPRTSPGSTSTLLHLGRPMEVPPRAAPAETLQMRPQITDEGRLMLNRSESDAANALAGLASGISRPETIKPPVPQPPQPPRPPPR